MKFSDQLAFVRKNMKKNRMRLFMTILATTMGCAFLIILASIGFGLQKSIQDNILADSDVTKIQVHGKQDAEAGAISKEEAQKLKEIANVKTVTYQKHWHTPTNLALENRTGASQMITMNMEAEKDGAFKLSAGRLAQTADEAVVGYQFNKALLSEEERQKLSEAKEGEQPQVTGYTGDLLGKTVTVTVRKLKDGAEVKQDYQVKIVGVAEKPAQEWMENQNLYLDEAAEGSLDAFLKDSDDIKEMGGIAYMPETSVYAGSVEDVKSISTALKDKGYMVYSVTEELEQLNVYFLIIKIGLIFVGTIAVLIASIGIFNTMTMAVTERTQEIGIMKAIGAQPRTIRAIFLYESAWIGLVGAVAAVIISYAFSYGVNALIPLVIEQFLQESPPKDFMFSAIPPSLVLTAVSISLAVALLSGVRPAAKATRTNVLSALRRDL